MYNPLRWVGNMETYSNGPQILQGQSIYQVVGKPSVMPQVQQAVQSNASLPNIVPSGYQYNPTSNMVASSGLNRPAEMPAAKAVNQTNFAVQDVDNSNKVLFWIHNPGYRNNPPNLNLVPGNKQRDQVQNIQSTAQGMSNASGASVATITAQKPCSIPNLAIHTAKEPVKIPEPTHVNLNTHVNEKVGSLKIHISESFLPWNITNKTVLDLEFMRHLFNISGVDVILTDAKQNEKAIRTAVEQLLYNRVLSDWLVLKCEEKEIPFLKVNNQVEIYTASNFAALLNVVTQETCLPLPFIAEDKNFIKYLYLNFPRTGNDKVKKLNTPIFHVADSGKKRLLCRYPGIRLDCDFENRVESFVIHVHQSALLAYENSIPKIRQYIIYRHVIWGFLQMWIRRVMDKFNQCFKFEDIAKNLSLCRADDGKSNGNDNELIYDLNYLNCYLKFDPVVLRNTKASFMLDNFSTNIVCNLAIVQFYKQFFLINDMHFSDALKNTVLFFRDYYSQDVVKENSCVGVPPNLKSLRLVPRNNYRTAEQQVALTNSAYRNVVNANLSANTSRSVLSQGITVGGGKNIVRVEPDKTSATPVPEKPRLKARTVEEINSSVDLVNRTDASNSVVAPDRLKTRTVEEINSSVDLGKRTEMNDRAVASAPARTPDSKRMDKTHRLNYESFVTLIQKFMENCYASNRTELCTRDEAHEEVMIRRRFDEAVRRAIGVETIESFIEKIYVYLQMYFTNSTSQNILNKLIWRAIEAKYPHLKEHVSKNIVQSLKNKSSSRDPRNSNKASTVKSVESGPRLNETVVRNDQNDNQNVTPTLPVAQQPDVTNSDPEVVVCSSEENDGAVSAVSKEQEGDVRRDISRDTSRDTSRDISRDTSRDTSRDISRDASRDTSRDISRDASRDTSRDSHNVSPEKINEQVIPVPSTTEEPKDKNACSSPSSERERLSKKPKKHNKQRRSKESEKECVPYRNTLTFVRVSTSPATFRISSKSEANSKTQSTEMDKNKSCGAPEETPIQTSNEILETDEAPKEQEQPAQTVEEVEVCEERPRQQDYSKYNLKRCSVVLNSKEVEMYMKKCRKKKRRKILSEESDAEQDRDYVPGRGRRKKGGDDSDDKDFITERKRIRRAVSEIQYMEARTRVLQRLRKRKYVGYERTRISGEELDSFVVRNGSVSRSSSNENSLDGSEGEYEIEGEKDSEPKEIRRRKTQTKKGPEMKEVRVVLVRLEDTPEYAEHCVRLLRKEKLNPSLDYLKRKNLPRTKRKYFEMREGKLYLKEGYHVKDGKIVRADAEVSQMRPKREPESPARETDFDSLIKRESLLD